MTTPKTPEDLAHHIEALVAAYVGEAERVAQAALGRAFTQTRAQPRRRSRSRSAAATSSRQGPRRSAEHIAELADRLADAIAEQPGEAMTRFAEQLDVPVRELHRPMTVLKKQGRIRSVGQRHKTRYFPTARARTSS